MRLPSEIIDQIVTSVLQVSDCDSLSLVGRNLGWTGTWDQFINAQFRAGKLFPEVVDEFEAQDLTNIRLISHVWDESLRRLLKQHQWWRIHFDSWASLERILACLPEQKLPPVQKLEIKTGQYLRSIIRKYKYEPEMFEGHEVTDEQILLTCYEDRPEPSPDLKQWEPGFWSSPKDEGLSLHYEKTAEHKLLRQLFNKLPQIQTLAVSFPAAASYYDTSEEYLAECFDIPGLREMLSTIQYGFRTPAMRDLVDLRLDVPCTRDVGVLAQALSPQNKYQLKHLWLQITDATGPSGSGDYSGTEYAYSYEESDDAVDGTMTNAYISGFTPSNLQLMYPNRDHEDALWDFVGSCPNLESLGVDAAHYMRLEKLAFKAARPTHLRQVFLSRVYTDIDSLSRVISLQPDAGSNNAQAMPLSSPSIIRRISLNRVKVYADGGNWASFFHFLQRNCPNMEYLAMNNLSYFAAHNHFEHTDRLEQDGSVIWSENEDDFEALKSLLIQGDIRVQGLDRYMQFGRDVIDRISDF